MTTNKPFDLAVYTLLSTNKPVDLEYMCDKLTLPKDYSEAVTALKLSLRSLETFEDKIEQVLDGIKTVLDSEGDVDIVEYEGSADGYAYTIKLSDEKRTTLYFAHRKILKLLGIVTDLRIEAETIRLTNLAYAI